MMESLFDKLPLNTLNDYYEYDYHKLHLALSIFHIIFQSFELLISFILVWCSALQKKSQNLTCLE
jgi:hypothetical protein